MLLKEVVTQATAEETPADRDIQENISAVCWSFYNRIWMAEVILALDFTIWFRLTFRLKH